MQHRLEQFKSSKKSLKLFSGMLVRWPKQKDPGKLDIKKILKNAGETDGIYAIKNDVVAFVSDGELYVAPESYELLAALEDANFKKSNFHVPFSDRDLPQGKALKKWEKLIREALKANELATTPA